jgi:hypothetical protein
MTTIKPGGMMLAVALRGMSWDFETDACIGSSVADWPAFYRQPVMHLLRMQVRITKLNARARKVNQAP